MPAISTLPLRQPDLHPLDSPMRELTPDELGVVAGGDTDFAALWPIVGRILARMALARARVAAAAATDAGRACLMIGMSDMAKAGLEGEGVGGQISSFVSGCIGGGLLGHVAGRR